MKRLRGPDPILYKLLYFRACYLDALGTPLPFNEGNVKRYLRFRLQFIVIKNHLWCHKKHSQYIQTLSGNAKKCYVLSYLIRGSQLVEWVDHFRVVIVPLEGEQLIGVHHFGIMVLLCFYNTSKFWYNGASLLL